MLVNPLSSIALSLWKNIFPKVKCFFDTMSQQKASIRYMNHWPLVTEHKIELLHHE